MKKQILNILVFLLNVDKLYEWYKEGSDELKNKLSEEMISCFDENLVE